jgi:selenocysteine lyase/cysteine desulfurase
MELAGLLKEGLKDAGATLVTPESPAMSGGVVVIEVPKENQKTIADAMYSKFGIAALSHPLIFSCVISAG